MSKQPAIDLTFWVMKVCATTLGETAGDLLSMTLNVGYVASSVILISIFGLLLLFQLKASTYRPALYWLVILATSTAGTTMSDMLDRTLELGYLKGSLLLIALLCCSLGLWRRQVGTLDVQSIDSRAAEVILVTVLFSNTLGTALGDFLSDSSGLGYKGSALLISGLLVLITLAYFFTSLSKVMLFWLAFILTRPFGAELGDLMTKAHDKGGLGFGTVVSSAVLALILLLAIVYSSTRLSKRNA